MTPKDRHILLDRFFQMNENDREYQRTLETLVKEFDYLVIETLRRCFYNAGIDSDDLYQEGSIALMHALRGFNPAAGVQFTTYAITAIKNAILDNIRAQCHSRVAYNNEQSIRKAKRVLSEVNQAEEPTLETLAKTMGISEEEFLQKLISCRRNRPGYLNQKYAIDSNNSETDILAELLPGDSDCYETVIAKMRREAVIKAVNRLSDRMRNIALFLMWGYNPHVLGKYLKVPLSAIPDYIFQAQQQLYNELRNENVAHLFPEMSESLVPPQ